MRYPVQIERRRKIASSSPFPTFPKRSPRGHERRRRMEHAADALESALDFYFEAARTVPLPSRPKRGQQVIELPASLSAKVLLLNEMISQKVRPAALARRLRVTPQEVTRLIDLRHTTKIDGIAGALKALGKTMEIRAV